MYYNNKAINDISDQTKSWYIFCSGKYWLQNVDMLLHQYQKKHYTNYKVSYTHIHYIVEY